jgi:hypothetical protein
MVLPNQTLLLHLAAGAAAVPALSRIAWAQAYPSRPVHVFVGYVLDKFIAEETEKAGEGG